MDLASSVAVRKVLRSATKQMCCITGSVEVIGGIILLLAALFLASWVVILATGLACAVSPSCQRKLRLSVFEEPSSDDLPQPLDTRSIR